MPAKSEKQRKLFGLALSVKRGETPEDKVNDKIKNIANNMTEKELEKYAKKENLNLRNYIKKRIIEKKQGKWNG